MIRLYTAIFVFILYSAWLHLLFTCTVHKYDDKLSPYVHYIDSVDEYALDVSEMKLMIGSCLCVHIRLYRTPYVLSYVTLSS